MDRQEFTNNISMFLQHLIVLGEQPVIDFVLRSAEEQNRLFKQGLSKCDGYEKKSKHQFGISADLYLTDENGNIQFEWNKEKAEKYHKIWEDYGGKPMIEWDRGHFE